MGECDGSWRCRGCYPRWWQRAWARLLQELRNWHGDYGATL